MDRLFQDGCKLLAEGEFESAKKNFNRLLEADPRVLDWVSGYYCASYWDNRLETILSTRPGKDRGNRLIELFNSFEKEYESRGYPIGKALEAIRFCILGEAASNFRLAFQTEGQSVLDGELLLKLSECLLVSGDSKNALEVAEFASRTAKYKGRAGYFIAEALSRIGEKEKGLMHYRNSLVYSPEEFNPAFIETAVICNAIQELKALGLSGEELKASIGPFCLEKNYLPYFFTDNPEEPKSCNFEIEQTLPSLDQKSGNVTFKLRCRLIALSVHLWDLSNTFRLSHFKTRAEEVLQSLDPGFLDRRMKKN